MSCNAGDIQELFMNSSICDQCQKKREPKDAQIHQFECLRNQISAVIEWTAEAVKHVLLKKSSDYQLINQCNRLIKTSDSSKSLCKIIYSDGDQTYEDLNEQQGHDLCKFSSNFIECKFNTDLMEFTKQIDNIQSYWHSEILTENKQVFNFKIIDNPNPTWVSIGLISHDHMRNDLDKYNLMQDEYWMQNLVGCSDGWNVVQNVQLVGEVKRFNTGDTVKVLIDMEMYLFSLYINDEIYISGGFENILDLKKTRLAIYSYLNSSIIKYESVKINY